MKNQHADTKVWLARANGRSINHKRESLIGFLAFMVTVMFITCYTFKIVADAYFSQLSAPVLIPMEQAAHELEENPYEETLKIDLTTSEEWL